MGNGLDKPETTKETDACEGNGIACGVCSMQGWRPEMEDAHLCVSSIAGRPECSLFGVFDGHGGDRIARLCARELIPTLQATPGFKAAQTAEQWSQVLYRALLALDARLRRHAGEDERSGATAVVALVTPSDVLVANVGDSRCVLGRSGKAVEMSEDHKPTNPAERRRITRAGGSVALGRVNGELAVARAIGDYSFKTRRDLGPDAQMVTAAPDVRSMPRHSKDELLLLACDGVWDVTSSTDAVALAREELQRAATAAGAAGDPPSIRASRAADAVRAAAHVADSALDAGSRDNITALVAVFAPDSKAAGRGTTSPAVSAASGIVGGDGGAAIGRPPSARAQRAAAAAAVTSSGGSSSSSSGGGGGGRRSPAALAAARAARNSNRSRGGTSATMRRGVSTASAEEEEESGGRWQRQQQQRRRARASSRRQQQRVARSDANSDARGVRGSLSPALVGAVSPSPTQSPSPPAAVSALPAPRYDSSNRRNDDARRRQQRPTAIRPPPTTTSGDDPSSVGATASHRRRTTHEESPSSSSAAPSSPVTPSAAGRAAMAVGEAEPASPQHTAAPPILLPPHSSSLDQDSAPSEVVVDDDDDYDVNHDTRTGTTTTAAAAPSHRAAGGTGGDRRRPPSLSSGTADSLVVTPPVGSPALARPRGSSHTALGPSPLAHLPHQVAPLVARHRSTPAAAPLHNVDTGMPSQLPSSLSSAPADPGLLLARDRAFHTQASAASSPPATAGPAAAPFRESPSPVSVGGSDRRGHTGSSGIVRGGQFFSRLPMPHGASAAHSRARPTPLGGGGGGGGGQPGGISSSGMPHSPRDDLAIDTGVAQSAPRRVRGQARTSGTNAAVEELHRPARNNVNATNNGDDGNGKRVEEEVDLAATSRALNLTSYFRRTGAGGGGGGGGDDDDDGSGVADDPFFDTNDAEALRDSRRRSWEEDEHHTTAATAAAAGLGMRRWHTDGEPRSARQPHHHEEGVTGHGGAPASLRPLYPHAASHEHPRRSQDAAAPHSSASSRHSDYGGFTPTAGGPPASDHHNNHNRHLSQQHGSEQLPHKQQRPTHRRPGRIRSAAPSTTRSRYAAAAAGGGVGGGSHLAGPASVPSVGAAAAGRTNPRRVGRPLVAGDEHADDDLFLDRGLVPGAARGSANNSNSNSRPVSMGLGPGRFLHHAGKDSDARGHSSAANGTAAPARGLARLDAAAAAAVGGGKRGQHQARRRAGSGRDPVNALPMSVATASKGSTAATASMIARSSAAEAISAAREVYTRRMRGAARHGRGRAAAAAAAAAAGDRGSHGQEETRGGEQGGAMFWGQAAGRGRREAASGAAFGGAAGIAAALGPRGILGRDSTAAALAARQVVSFQGPSRSRRAADGSILGPAEAPGRIGEASAQRRGGPVVRWSGGAGEPALPGARYKPPVKNRRGGPRSRYR